MALKLIIFDWDGTLADSAGQIVAAMQQAFFHLGLAEPSAESIRSIIGLSLNAAIERLAPGLDIRMHSNLENEYRRAYAVGQAGTQLFRGAEKALEHFHSRNVILAVATGKSASGLQQALRESNTAKYFSSLRTADHCASKPSPEMLKEILVEVEMDGQEHNALMVGDTTFDLEMADNAGIASVAACYGAHERAVLARYSPLHFLNSIDELVSKLNID